MLSTVFLNLHQKISLCASYKNSQHLMAGQMRYTKNRYYTNYPASGEYQRTADRKLSAVCLFPARLRILIEVLHKCGKETWPQPQANSWFGIQNRGDYNGWLYNCSRAHGQPPNRVPEGSDSWHRLLLLSVTEREVEIGSRCLQKHTVRWHSLKFLQSQSDPNPFVLNHEVRT